MASISHEEAPNNSRNDRFLTRCFLRLSSFHRRPLGSSLGQEDSSTTDSDAEQEVFSHYGKNLRYTRDELVYEIPRFLKIFKDGRIKHLCGTDHAPAGPNLKTGVTSRDITMASSEHNLSARLYLPKLNNLAHKCPLLLYFHAGGFCLSS